MEAGQVSVKLGLDSDEFVNALSKAENEFNTLQENLKKSQSNFEKVSKAMAGMKQPTKEMTNLFDEIKTKLKEDQSAVDKFNKKLNELNGGLTKSKGAVSSLQGALGKLAVGGAAVVITKKLIDLGKQAIKTAGEFESLAVSFEVMAGGAEAGKKLTNQILELAAKTPLTTETLSDCARTLLSFGEASDEVVNDLKLLGDISGGDVQKMQSLTLAFSQIGSTGRLAGQDLLQMINAGFNPLEAMAKRTGKSIGQLKDEMSKGLITFKDVKQAMIDATSEGGRFYGLMDKQSKTLEGRLSTLNDTWKMVSKTIGDAFLPMAKAAVDAMIKIGQATQTTINLLLDEKTTLKSLKEDWDKYWASKRKVKDTITFTFESYVDEKKAKEAEKQVNKLKTGFEALSGTGGGKSSAKKSRDKALDEYKKFVEEYKKATNEYEATLEARNYVEATLGIDPLRQQQEYDTAIEVYKNYFAKIKEISQSGAKNKAELLKLEESKLAQDLSKIQMEKELETQRKLYDIRKGYADERRDLEIKAMAQERLGGFLGSFQTGYEEKLSLLQWYYKERETITDMHFASLEDKQKAFNDLELTLSVKQAEAEKQIWQQRGQEVSGIFSQTFNEILTNQADFSENMQQLVLNLSRYIAKELFQYAFTQFMLLRQAQEGTTSVMAQFAETTNNLSSGLIGIAQSAGVTTAATQAMSAAQTALQPLVEKTSAQIASAASDYSQAAQSAQELAASIAQMAVAEAAYSVAKIPFVGGFLAPAAATLTGAAIAASTALVSGASMAGRVLGKIGSSGGGGGGNLASSGSSGFSLPKFHSGGIVPGTKEQLAVLKGGERVLNPAENALYTSNNEEGAQGSGSVVNVWNIKAFDSKDVITTLKENEATLNQITARGIKDNKQGLRTTVQNA